MSVLLNLSERMEGRMSIQGRACCARECADRLYLESPVGVGPRTGMPMPMLGLLLLMDRCRSRRRSLRMGNVAGSASVAQPNGSANGNENTNATANGQKRMPMEKRMKTNAMSDDAE